MESSLLSISYCAASFSNEYKTAQRDRTENTNQHNDFNFANIYLLTYFDWIFQISDTIEMPEFCPAQQQHYIDTTQVQDTMIVNSHCSPVIGKQSRRSLKSEKLSDI